MKLRLYLREKVSKKYINKTMLLLKVISGSASCSPTLPVGPHPFFPYPPILPPSTFHHFLPLPFLPHILEIYRRKTREMKGNYKQSQVNYATDVNVT